jgi:ABC-type multidrug transport system fused ATPase/permease subunit
MWISVPVTVGADLPAMWKSRRALTLRRLWRVLEIRGERRLLGAVVLGGALHAAGHGGLAAGAGLLSRALLDPALFARWPDGGTMPILVLAAAGVAAAIAKLAGGALASWGESLIAGQTGAWVRLSVLDRVLGSERGEHENQGQSRRSGDPTRTTGAPAFGEQLAALTTHIVEVERGVAQGLFGEVRAILQLLPLGALLAVLAPRLAVSGVVALLAFVLLVFVLRRAFKRAHARAAAEAGALAVAADEAVRHAELWTTYGATDRIRGHVARLGQSIASGTASLRLRATLLSSTSEVLGAAGLLLVLSLVSAGAVRLEPAAVIPFAITFFMAYRPLRELVDARLARARGEAALGAALGTPSDADPPRRLRPVGPSSEGPANAGEPARWPLAPLLLEDVRTCWGAPATRPLTLTVPPGAIVAVVGPTGAGKTSLLRALLGLDPLLGGTVRYGEAVLDSSERAGVGPRERPFAWVPQDAPVLADTLEANVLLGAPTAPDARGETAGAMSPAALLVSLGAADFVRGLTPRAVLGTERPLSGGERRWVALARALATGLPVLLLDEPTSAHDPEAQERMLDALCRLRGERTILFVTHRPEPLRIADLVIRLDDARGAEVIRRTAQRGRARDEPGAGRPTRSKDGPTVTSIASA